MLKFLKRFQLARAIFFFLWNKIFLELQKIKENAENCCTLNWCKTTIRLDVQVHTHNLSTWELRRKDFCKLEVNLEYTVKPVWKKIKERKETSLKRRSPRCGIHHPDFILLWYHIGSSLFIGICESSRIASTVRQAFPVLYLYFLMLLLSNRLHK